MQSSDLTLEQRRQAAYRGIAQIIENRKRRRESWRAEAKALWEEWHGDPFFILGVALYWGEGKKSPTERRLELTNADVNLLRIWLRWCRRFLPGVPLYNALGIHDTCDVTAARQFWKRELGVDVHAVS